jgi:hypothetical protein
MAITKYHRLGNLQTIGIHFSCFWKLGSPRGSVSVEGRSLYFKMHLAVHPLERTSVMSSIAERWAGITYAFDSFYKGPNPIPKGSALMTKSGPKYSISEYYHIGN